MKPCFVTVEPPRGGSKLRQDANPIKLRFGLPENAGKSPVTPDWRDICGEIFWLQILTADDSP
jgi:hypothetical protein